jgi:hypothetical protein
MLARTTDYSPHETAGNQEILYYCEKHGVMNKSADIGERVNQIAKKK